MSQQDRTEVIVVNHQTLKQVADWLFKPQLFASIRFRSNALWTPRMLALAALVWACGSTAETLGDRFTRARKIVSRVFRWLPNPGQTYQGFVKMLRKKHVELMFVIEPHIRVQMKETFPGQWTVCGFVVFAADGSRIELPRTKDLEAVFSPQKKKGSRNAKKTTGKRKERATSKPQSKSSKQKKADSPQMWLTLLWHLGTELPWSWRTGPSDSSERGHLQEMLKEMPENSLITADAGFVGYDFWSSILAAGHNFLARVGGNVSLLKELGCARQHGHTVYLWPDAAARKQKQPLVLRMIELHNGKHPVYLVTNLPKSRLSDRQAAMIYSKRWGVELFFRSFKQTLGVRKLTSRSPENAKLELSWSLLGLWCVCLLGQRELVESGQEPKRLSPASAIRAFRKTITEWRIRPESPHESLWHLLRQAVQDDYHRTSSKDSRHYPRKKKRTRIKPPKITIATREQVNAAKELTRKMDTERLTA